MGVLVAAVVFIVVIGLLAVSHVVGRHERRLGIARCQTCDSLVEHSNDFCSVQCEQLWLAVTAY